MRYETPKELLARLKLGREEFCQRLLTTLLLAAPYPKWNARSSLCPAGVTFLRALYERNFDAPWPNGDPVFVDEFELPARHEAEKGGAPDYAVVWPDRLWLIELKTEKASHRHQQIPQYFELARAHHPHAAIDVTYITPPMEARYTPQNPWERYAHIAWGDLEEAIRTTWPAPEAPGEKEVVDGLIDAIKSLDKKPAEWRAGLVAATESEQVMQRGLDAAAATASDGVQRAIDFRPGDLDELLELRLRLRDELAAAPEGSPLRHVRPWTWRIESTGAPLTEAGRELGFEIRLSRYAKPLY